MRGKLSVIILICILFTISACSVDKRVKKAPTSKKELGFIVIGATLSEVQKSGFEYRVVNKRHKLMEVFGSESKIKAAFPNAKIEKNQLNNHLNLSEARQEPMTEAEYLNEFVKDCNKVENLSVFIKNNSETEVSQPIANVYIGEKGQTIELEAIEFTGATKFLWLLANVGMSTYDQYLYAGKDLSLNLKGIGQYQITAIAKDDNNVCGLAPYSFWVTSNEDLIEDDLINELPLIVPSMDHLEGAGLMLTKEDRVEKIIVAVLDSGVNYNHPGLNQFIFKNEGEIPGNGIDDDGNGFDDDYVGYDFFHGDPHPMDDLGHGSHVAGLIADVNSGVTNNAIILPIKIASAFGVDSASIAGAIMYAVDQGAKVINLSIEGRGGPSLAEEIAYDYAKDNDVVVVVAAGNGDGNGDGINLNRIPIYPASMNLDNMIAVSASSEDSKPLTKYSNFGSVIDIVAPGGDGRAPIYSSAILNNLDVFYTEMSGTSMATPIVAGAVAEILSADSTLTPVEVREIIVQSGTYDRRLRGLTGTQKHLHIDNAVKLAEGL